jgi:kinesin family protein C1
MVNLSPTEESLQESICSLRLAKQVNQCELGKPKKQVKDAPSHDTPHSHSSSSSSTATPSRKGVASSKV